MKRILFWIVLSCLIGTTAFGQVSNSNITGTVTDATKAVLPGVTVTSTNNATSVSVNNVTNEAGAYTILSIIPGTYTVTAELPGFRKETYTNVELANGVTVRLNFALQVASQAQNVEVTVAADTLIQTSSQTVGTILGEKKVNDLPNVGNNVLDQLNVLGGLDNLVPTGVNQQSGYAFGREGTTLAGISAQDVPVLRDGIMVQDTRWPTGINTNTVINPDLVGEVRLIVSPVDAELGRGNGAVQITTRSGTNQFRGAAVWNLQNAATNSNLWSQNETHTPLNWLSQNQGTISGGGPIIKNKTFFYALWDMYFNRQRAFTSAAVLTPCAKNGIYRYWDNWNNAAAGATTVSVGGTPTRAAVDYAGNPVAPTTNPNGSPYTGKLEYVSVFGALPANLPAASADCSNISALVQPGAAWDTFRTHPDTTGLIARTNALFPVPNDFNSLNNSTSYDGLNVAGYRYLRGFRGLDNLFSVGESAGDRRQINFRVDHNFNQKHRAFVNFSYERTSSDDTLAALPGTWSNNNYHRPMTVAVNFTSTLSASMVNEARFGYKFSGTNVIAPWDLAANTAGINKYLPAPVNGFRILPDIVGAIGACSPITGARPPGNCIGGQSGGGNLTTTSIDRSPVWTYGDSLSLTKGKHTIKVGAEIRASSSTTQGSTPFGGFFTLFHSDLTVLSGAAVNAPLANGGPTSITSQNPNMSGIGSSDSGRAQKILNYLSGSITSFNNEYFLNKATDTQFCDFRCSELVTDTIAQREFDVFFKDDYKVKKNLTLNLGLRYDWYGVPWSPVGASVAPALVGGAFGRSGTNFNAWMNPNSQNGSDTSWQFVGKNSPNSGKLPFANDWRNFGPAVGFAYQLPWLGEGKTTIRGGYQITYQGGSRFNTMQQPLNGPPGRVYQGSYVGTSAQPYLDLTSLSSANVPTPLPAGVAPMTLDPVTDRTQTANFFDPNYTSPYVQNLVLGVTRQVKPNLTVNVQYIGTLARKLYSSMNLNQADFLYNGLASDFASVRAGTDITPVLSKMLNGINLCTAISGCTPTPGLTYGAIGTGGNTAAIQMRASPTFAGNLALGNFNQVAQSLNTLDYTQFGCPNAGAAGNCGLPAINSSTIKGAVMRANGFPENFIFTNPQFATANYLANMGSSNYHSLQTEVTLRPTHGFSGTINYTFSKNLGIPGGTYTNAVNRRLDYTILNNNHTHILRSNGNIDLPFGPGKFIAGSSHGVLGRAIEGWRLGGIWTLSSGAFVNITGQSNLYNNGVPDVANAALLKELLADGGTKWGVPNGAGQLEGDFFDRTKWIKVMDPQCANVTSQQSLANIVPGVPRCTLQAIARIVPQNTPGAIANIDGKGTTGAYVLVNPQPGAQGNLGQNVIRGIAPWRFDANLAKSFKLSETRSLQFRADAYNVLNTAQVNTPGLSINNPAFGPPTPFGEITQKGGTAGFGRIFQAQLRLNF